MPSPAPCSSSQSMIARLAGAIVQAVEEVAVDGRAVADVGVAVEALGRLDRADDRQPERLGEVPVALVLAGHGHDRPGAVAHQHVVGDEHRDRARRSTGLMA